MSENQEEQIKDGERERRMNTMRKSEIWQSASPLDMRTTRGSLSDSGFAVMDRAPCLILRSTVHQTTRCPSSLSYGSSQWEMKTVKQHNLTRRQSSCAYEGCDLTSYSCGVISLSPQLKINQHKNVYELKGTLFRNHCMLISMFANALHLNMWPWTTKPVLSCTGIFVAMANITLYWSKL